MITHRSVVRPLQSLGLVTERIGRGDLSTPVAVAGPREIELLSHRFEAMRAQLQASQDELSAWAEELETRVAQRTRELAALYEVSREISSRLDIEHVLRSVTDKARELLEGRIAVMKPQPTRLPLMVLGLLALLAAMWAGLVRLGWQLPPLRPTLPMAHGPLMVSGFLGTVIALERAVALRLRWAYTAPALTGLGALALILGLVIPAGALLITLGSLGLVAVFTAIVRRQTALFTVTMGLGALAWVVGNGLWLAGWPIPQVVVWWAGFLVLTIVGERLELSRLMRPPQVVRSAFVVATGLFGIGLVMSLFDFGLGTRLAGLGVIALALWLGRYDIARRTVRKTGLTRFVAACLLAGYVWLGVSGLLALLQGGAVAGPRYDAMLHALFLGFVFSMIFGHAPVIFPGVMGVSILFRQSFYVHLALLHASLVLRVAGDLAGWVVGRQWGGLLNVVALLLFLANTVRASRSA